MTCKKIFTFYEKHHDKSSADLAHQFLLALQDKGFDATFCLEEPADQSIAWLKNHYLENIFF